MAISLMDALKTAAVTKTPALAVVAQSLASPIATSTPGVTPSVANNISQGANFGAITITPISASASLSLFGGGGGGTGGVNISQVSQPTSNVSNQVSNVTTVTDVINKYISNLNTTNISNITGSPLSSGIGSVNPTVTPSSTVTPTVTPSQVSTQTATPTTTATQTAGAARGMAWWEYLIIGGVVIAAIYMISQALKGKKRPMRG